MSYPEDNWKKPGENDDQLEIDQLVYGNAFEERRKDTDGNVVAARRIDPRNIVVMSNEAIPEEPFDKSLIQSVSERIDADNAHHLRHLLENMPQAMKDDNCLPKGFIRDLMREDFGVRLRSKGEALGLDREARNG